MKLTVLRIDTVTTTVNCYMCFEYDVVERKSYNHFILQSLLSGKFRDWMSFFFYISHKFLTIYLYTNVMKPCVTELGLGTDKETKRLPSNFRWKYLPFNAW